MPPIHPYLKHRPLLRQVVEFFTPALQIQGILSFGFLFSLAVSIAYSFLNDPRYPTEQLFPLLVGLGLSVGCFVVGSYLTRVFHLNTYISVRKGAWVVVSVWALSCTISAIVFVLAGFPDPARVAEFSLLRRFVDGWYESMSGFTTTGTSILPSVEAFPRGILLWRSLTHWYGGMGIAYLAVTLWKRFRFHRSSIINAEAESPNYTPYKDEGEAVQSGYNFLKVYVLLTVLLIALLTFSGAYFRLIPHVAWHDNVFEAVNYAASIMGTGGFGIHNASAGLPIEENGRLVIGGLRNPVSDWISGIFMVFAGMNFSIWYLAVFERKFKDAALNREFQGYLIYCFICTVSIWYFLVQYNVYPTAIEALRYSLFNMASIVSTTGLADWNFHYWPSEAQAILFICYLVGGCVGSTAGGLKVTRFLVAGKYVWMEIRNALLGEKAHDFTIDGVQYTHRAAGLITATMGIYYFIFLMGAVLLMIVSGTAVLADGTVKQLDFAPAIASSIANLGNIGPAVAIGNIDAGPSGNYFAFTVAGKILMIFLMFVGRVGVMTVLMCLVFHRNKNTQGAHTHVAIGGQPAVVENRVE